MALNDQRNYKKWNRSAKTGPIGDDFARDQSNRNNLLNDYDFVEDYDYLTGFDTQGRDFLIGIFPGLFTGSSIVRF